MRETGSSSPLYGLKVIQRTSAAGTEPPYLIDSKMLGVLYLSGLKFDADPYTGFRKNLTTLRIEVKRLYHVRNVQGARKDRGDMTEAEAKKLAAERGWEVQKQDKSFRLMDHNGGFVTGGDWANPDSEFYRLSLADLATALES
jgi:hypothetical protein